VLVFDEELFSTTARARLLGRPFQMKDEIVECLTFLPDVRLPAAIAKDRI